MFKHFVKCLVEMDTFDSDFSKYVDLVYKVDEKSPYEEYYKARKTLSLFIDEFRGKWLAKCKHGQRCIHMEIANHELPLTSIIYPMCQCGGFYTKNLYRGILRHNFRNGFHD